MSRNFARARNAYLYGAVSEHAQSNVTYDRLTPFKSSGPYTHDDYWWGNATATSRRLTAFKETAALTDFDPASAGVTVEDMIKELGYLKLSSSAGASEVVSTTAGKKPVLMMSRIMAAQAIEPQISQNRIEEHLMGEDDPEVDYGAVSFSWELTMLLDLDDTRFSRAGKRGTVKSTTMTAQGTGYTNASVTASGGGGSGFAATAVIESGRVTGLTITNRGAGYHTAPTLAIGGDGSGATATATLDLGLYLQDEGIVVRSYGAADGSGNVRRDVGVFNLATLGWQVPAEGFVKQTATLNLMDGRLYSLPAAA